MQPEQKRQYGMALIGLVVGAAAVAITLRWLFLHAFNGIEEDTSLIGTNALLVCLAVAAASAAFLGSIIGLQTTRDAWHHGKGLVAPLLVVFVVLGSIYGGITGITEAAAMGSVAVLFLIVIRGEFSFNLLREASMRTFKSTGTIIWVTFGATALAGAYTIAGGPTYVANLIVGYDMPTMVVLMVMMVIFLILGAFMDWTGIVLLVMPVFLPIVLKLPASEIGLTGGLDSDAMVRVWFGILFCVNMQVSFLSPPFGPAAFYLKSVAPPHISLPDIFRGFLPFIDIQLLVLALVLVFPEITRVFL
jgi:TRAP-type mannitol/chloroaromatic compound transport system permease large subunit